MSFSLWSVAGFVLAVCILVTVHEFGHYWVARRLGFKVLRFSVGFGRPLWMKVGGEDRTEYVLAAVPLGGYVRLLDEREGPVAAEDLPRSFTRRPHWQRIAVLLAGPACNFIFAIVLLTGMLMVFGSSDLRPLLAAPLPDSPALRAGVQAGDEVVAVNDRTVTNQRETALGLLDGVTSRQPVTIRLRDSSGRERIAHFEFASAAERRALSDPNGGLGRLGLRFQEIALPPILGVVKSAGPAAQAGLVAGDEILSINGEPIRDFQALALLVRAHPNESIAVRYRRAGHEYSTRVAVAQESDNGLRIGRMQVGPVALAHTRVGPVQAVTGACREAWNLTTFQARMLWRMLAGDVSVKNLSGPLTIAELAGDSASAGVETFMSFLVLISLALGFMNLLPIPILDGGQIVMQSIEWLKGSPLSERVQVAGQQLGIVLVVLLLGLALYNDISRQFG